MRIKRDGITRCELEGETVLLDLATSQYLGINGAGTVLVRLLDEERSDDDLARALMAEFGIDEARARADVGAFLAQLDGLDLLERSEAG